MSFEEASRREISTFEALQEAMTTRGNIDANMAIFTDHTAPYAASVEHLLAAVQAYDAAATDLIASRKENT